MIEEVPPLKIWKIFIPVIAAIYFTAFIYVKLNPKVYKELDVKTEFLLKNYIAPMPDTTVSVVVLGSSLVESGIDLSTNFRNESNAKYNRDVRVYKIFRPNADTKLFTHQSNVLDLLLKYPPKILCIEDRLIAEETDPANSNWLILRLLQSNYLNFRLHGNLIAKGSVPFQEFPQKKSYRIQKVIPTISESREEGLRFKIKKMQDNMYLNPYLEQLIAKGTKIVILHIPRYNELEKIIHSGENEARYRELIKTYKMKYNVDYWRYQGKLSADNFMDVAHLNYKGMKKYSDWLLGEIAQEPINPSSEIVYADRRTIAGK